VVAVLVQVASCGQKQVRAILHATEHPVASVAEQAAHAAGGVVVIDCEVETLTTVPAPRVVSATDRATAALHGQKPYVVRVRQSIRAAKDSPIKGATVLLRVRDPPTPRLGR
jgi:hypothetical protein